MKAIMLMFDTLSKAYLPNYGNQWVQAPNFDRLREKCMTFDNFYGGSMPCMPARRELHTGKYNFLHRCWGPLEAFDYSIFEKLNKENIYTHLITDHSHYFEDGGATYHNRYSSWEGFRGQEGDRWIPRLEALEDCNENPLNKSADNISRIQHFANRTQINEEADMSSVQVIDRGLDFLEKNHEKDNWFLQLECFDPHEPFFVPEKYRELYKLTETKDIPYWPVYQHLSEEEKAHYEGDIDELQKEYAALISMCDYHLGRVLDFMDEQNLWDDTLLIVNTDHGFLLGEHNWLGKNVAPMYEEIVHIPFFMHVPQHKLNGQRIDGLAQTIDLPPTLAEYFAIEPFENMDGRSLFHLIDQQQVNHESILFGTNGGHVNLFDGRYTYMKAAATKENTPLVNYTLMPTMIRGFYPKESLAQMSLSEGDRFTNGVPCLKVPLLFSFANSYEIGTLLFDLKTDPEQNSPIEDSELHKQLDQKLFKKMQEVGAPAEEFIRLGYQKSV
ncbi:sulfatase [Enterococcus sp. UD-01]|jgi:arylsulfatase A-like enzyme|uniref:sulfatase n=1 Tax=Enterococcus sp. UD-01 TaxID=3373911 RepID=UPI003837EB95